MRSPFPIPPRTTIDARCPWHERGSVTRGPVERSSVRFAHCPHRGMWVFTWAMTATDESRALEHLHVRLCARFPDVPVAQVQRMITDAHEQYDGRPIRDFIPVLVEREVREQLRSGQAVPEQRSPRSTARSRPLENA